MISIPRCKNLAFPQSSIYYPEGGDENDMSRCLVYHPPEAGRAQDLAQKILSLYQCPLISYDSPSISLGEKLTTYAFQNYHQVDVWGSSYGGAVATAALEIYLSKNPKDVPRVTLTSLDSFTTSSCVDSHWKRTANLIGWISRNQFDAIAPMKKLIKKGVKINILCHLKDPVIPPGARMAEYIAKLPQEKAKNIALIQSPEAVHGELTEDIIQELKFIY